jgi:L-serine dehydratase
MQEAIARGLETEGMFHGGLRVMRRAGSFFTMAKTFQEAVRRRPLVFAYALAVSEENAAGGRVVTAPTCGSCGVIPAVLYLFKTETDAPETKILRALATAGLIGNLIKTNASVAGAEVGCQGEVGSACSMAAAAAAQLLGGSIRHVEYAATIGMEHFLGLTCDPMKGLVQIPCIERNAQGASRALDAAIYARMTDGHHFVPFDKVIRVMKQTGHDLPSIYKETAEGGLAID